MTTNSGVVRQTFSERLQGLGFSCYEDYLRSDHWREFRVRYRRSSMPQECLGCSATPIELHHRNYGRLGRETFRDVVPLCRTCHQQLHDHAREHGLGVHATGEILQQLHGWTDAERKARFLPFTTVIPRPIVATRPRLGSPERDARRLERIRHGKMNRSAPGKTKKMIRREAAAYAFSVLHAAYGQKPHGDHRVMAEFLVILDELRKRGRV